MNEQDIIAKATGKLQEIMPQLRISFTDGKVCIGSYTFHSIVKGSVTMSSFNYLLDQVRSVIISDTDGAMIVSTYIYPKLAAALAQHGIASLDCSGNCYISKESLFINISGQKKIVNAEDKSPYVESELKLIFYLLSSEANLRKSYREMSHETGLSLGTISNCFDKMVKDGSLVKTGSKRFFSDSRKLTDIWQLEYNKSMKRRLFIQSYSFINNQARRKWEALILPEGMYWGGESGAYLLDRYLKPEKFTIYSDVIGNSLLGTGAFIPAESGEVRVYRKFWDSTEGLAVAPKLLIYADLMGSGDSRCLEAAKRIMGYEDWDYKARFRKRPAV